MDVATAGELSDDDFISAFEGRALDDFPHRFHLRVAWIYIQKLGVDGAIARLASEIRDLANGRGQGTLYHETITRAWAYLVADATSDVGRGTSFRGLLQAHPELLDKQLLLTHYRRETLGSSEARERWVAPDLRPLPGAPPSTAGSTSPVGTTAIAPGAFRGLMRSVPTAVAVVAGRDALDVHATTISSITSVTAEPPTICFAVREDSRILPLIRGAGCFSVSFLADTQARLAEHFASGERSTGHAQFENVPHRAGHHGLPVLTDAAAWLECDMHAEHVLVGRVIVFGVVTAGGQCSAHPLLRVSGGYV